MMIMAVQPERPKSVDSGTKEKEAYYKEIDYDESNMFTELLGSKGLKLVTVASGERIVANKTPLD